jgi:hypothetical protein
MVEFQVPEKFEGLKVGVVDAFVYRFRKWRRALGVFKHVCLDFEGLLSILAWVNYEY